MKRCNKIFGPHFPKRNIFNYTILFLKFNDFIIFWKIFKQTGISDYTTEKHPSNLAKKTYISLFLQN